MKPSDRIISAPRGTAAMAIAYATSNGASRLGEVTAYVQEGYRLAPLVGIDPSVVVAQSVHETTYNGHPWFSYWWFERLNPAGIGITGDPVENAQSFTWPNGTASAQSHFAHLLVYALGPADAGSKWFQVTGQSIMAVDPRYEAYVAAYGNTAQAATIDDLGGTWATDTNYGPKVAARGNAIFPNLPDQETTPTVPTYATAIPGLPGGPLQTSYPIRLNIMPLGNGFQRPGIKAHTPRRSVQHGTGNPTNPSAMAEAQYFVNGAEGRQASVHYCTDDREAVVVVPLDEVTWQAADAGGPGNMNGFSCEMMEATAIWNDTVRRDNLIFVAADLMGRTAARLGATVPEQHWTFNAGARDRHDCPNKLRHTTHLGRPAWDVYAERWQAARADELRRMGQTPTTTTTAPPLPPLVPRVPIVEPTDAPNKTFYFDGRLYQRVSPARLKLVRQAVAYAKPDGKSIAAREPLPKGKAISVPYVTDGEDGVLYRASRSGTYVKASNFTERPG